MARKKGVRYFTLGFPEESEILERLLQDAHETGQSPTSIMEIRIADFYLGRITFPEGANVAITPLAFSSTQAREEGTPEKTQEGKRQEEEEQQRKQEDIAIDKWLQF